MAKSHPWNLEWLYRDTKEWVHSAQQRQILYDESTEALLKALHSAPIDPKYRFSPSRMSALAVWYGASGIVEIIEQKVDGWSKLRQRLLYEHWQMRIVIRLFDEDTRENKGARLDFNDPALCLAHSLATNEHEIADWTGQRMLRALDDGAFHTLDFTPFEPFVLKLFAIWKGSDVDYAGRLVCGQPVAPLGVYQSVLDAWDDPTKLEAALLATCDYHCSRIEDPDDNAYPEFMKTPYDVFPAEILAIQRVRDDLGLPTPPLDHPLMNSPLANPPNVPPAVDDELLSRIIAEAHRVFPNI